MDFLEKCLKSPSLTHGSDGLFRKIHNKFINKHMKLMDFLEKCLRSPSLTHGRNGFFGKILRSPSLTHGSY